MDRDLALAVGLLGCVVYGLAWWRLRAKRAVPTDRRASLAAKPRNGAPVSHLRAVPRDDPRLDDDNPDTGYPPFFV